jgi:hypothetical protein
MCILMPRSGTWPRKVVRVLLNNQNTKSLDMVLTDLTSTVKCNTAVCILMPRSGTRPRKAVRVLLNNRNTKSLDMVLADLTNTVKLDTGAVRHTSFPPFPLFSFCCE